MSQAHQDPAPAQNRISWDEYFMQIAHLVAKRSTCLRRSVGAVLVRDRRMIATGYNGSPRGMKHCEEVGCLRAQQNVPSGERHEICRGLHGEQNVIIQAAIYGVPIEGSTLYCTTQPCVICTKMLINAGIKSIIFEGNYPDPLSLTMLKEAGIELVQFAAKTPA